MLVGGLHPPASPLYRPCNRLTTVKDIQDYVSLSFGTQCTSSVLEKLTKSCKKITLLYLIVKTQLFVIFARVYVLFAVDHIKTKVCGYLSVFLSDCMTASVVCLLSQTWGAVVFANCSAFIVVLPLWGRYCLLKQQSVTAVKSSRSRLQVEDLQLRIC